MSTNYEMLGHDCYIRAKEVMLYDWGFKPKLKKARLILKLCVMLWQLHYAMLSEGHHYFISNIHERGLRYPYFGGS